MSPSPSPVNRFFVCPQYAIYYRRLKTLDWVHTARSDYAVLHLLGGAVKFTVGENSGELLPNQSVLVDPSIEAIGSGQSVELLLLTLAPSFVVDHAVRMGLIGEGAIVAFRQSLVEPDDRLPQLAHTIAAELKDEKPGREIVLGALIDQVLVQLLRRYSNMPRSEELELSRVGLIDRRIRRSVELMHAQLEHDLSLKEIAGASYLSPFHFVRVFKKLTGTTPHAYLAGIRAARAQLLLAEPNLTVSEVSSRVGYSSPSHFTKAFRQATGLAPRAFRKALIRANPPN